MSPPPSKCLKIEAFKICGFLFSIALIFVQMLAFKVY
jgi:hypothetical protein